MISGDDIYFPKEVHLFGSVRCPSRKYLRAVRSNQRSPPLSFYGLRLPSLPSHKYPTRIAVEIQKKQQQPRRRRKKPSTPRSLRSPGLSAHPDLVFVRGTASKSASWKSWISSKRLEIVEEISEEMMNGVVNGAPINNSLEKPLKIFIGYDPREDLAYEVCRYSILKRSSIPIEINPIKQSELRKNGLYWRERGKLESTEFSFTRFLTPHLANFDGWAMFVDCDFLYLEDIKELRSLLDDKYAVMCVQHDYTPKETTKMDGAVQTVYPRKNWSSMVLYNCGHPKNKVLTPEVVNTQTGAYLHRFQWLDDSEIGSIPFVWNFLVGHNKVVENDPSTYPKAIHYTLGGPWFEAWKNCEFGDLWTKESEEYQKVDKAQVE